MSKGEGRLVRSGRFRAAALGALASLTVGGLVALAWPSPDPDRLWEQAYNELRANQFDRAGASLARLGRLRAPTPKDRVLAAQVAMARGRNEQALNELALVPDDHPLAPQARLQTGQLELRRKRYVPAEAALLKALELDPKRVQARRELIYIYGMQLRRPELDATFRALSEGSALSYREVFLWCLTRGVTWEAREVEETLGKCLQADPNDRWSRLGLAEGLLKQGRFAETEAILAPLPETDADARDIRVRLALDRGDDVAAEALLAGGPLDHVGLALLRGRFALARGDGPEAVRHFRIAHDRAPNLRESIFGLGQALQKTGDPAAAPLIEEARKHDRLGSLVQRAAVEANRSDPNLILDLGDACAAVGRIPEARAWYNLAVGRDPLDTRAQQSLARLKDPDPKSGPR
jgi:tetratricopeptide (TPR) repeat protein